MSEWDPDLYLRHADERGRPFLDLLARVDVTPYSIVDLGCGPGQLTPVLQERWPHAMILGVDSSAEMIEAAGRRDDGPSVSYVQADVATWEPAAPVDLIVSNAMFQWVPDQLDVIRRLAGHVAPGGAFALQVPNNFDEPSHVLLHELASRPPYAEHTDRSPRAAWHRPAGVRRAVRRDLGRPRLECRRLGDDVPARARGRGPGVLLDLRHRRTPSPQALPDDSATGSSRSTRLRCARPTPPSLGGPLFPFTRVFAVAELLDWR